MAGRIFINYRRGDDAGFTGRLFDHLERTFSSERLFIDVDNIPAGSDFVEVLEEQVTGCDVMLSVIGRGWLDAKDDDGARRLDNPDDFVRIEIETALKQRKRVIPVLVNGASMPRSDTLPPSLQPLVRRNAVRLTHERFRTDAHGLIQSIELALREVEAARRAGRTPARPPSAARIRAATTSPEQSSAEPPASGSAAAVPPAPAPVSSPEVTVPPASTESRPASAQVRPDAPIVVPPEVPVSITATQNPAAEPIPNPGPIIPEREQIAVLAAPSSSIVRGPKDLASGILFLALGGASVAVTQLDEDASGSLLVPRILAVLVAGFGAASLLRGLLQDGPRLERIGWRPLLFIGAGCVMCALLIPRLGMPAGLAALGTFAAAALPGTRFDGLVFAIFAAASAMAFGILGVINIPLPLLGSWLK